MVDQFGYPTAPEVEAEKLLTENESSEGMAVKLDKIINYFSSGKNGAQFGDQAAELISNMRRVNTRGMALNDVHAQIRNLVGR